jgi:hypothetical protein
VTAVGVAGLIGGLVALRGRAAASSVTFSGRPAAYRIVYRTDTLTGGQDVTRWESLAVARPFAAADLTFDAPPEASSPGRAGYVATASALFDVDAGGLHLVAAKQPGVPPGDQDLATQLPQLLARHLATDTGSVQTVAGRRCHVFRLLEPPSGPIKPLAGAGEHDDLCIDSDGLVLSEAWTYGGNLVYTRRALTVALSSGPMPSTAGATAPSGQAAPTLVPDPDPQTFIAVPPAPAGFTTDGAFDFRLPDPGGPGLQASSVVWAFAGGADVVTVEAGTEAGGSMPWQADDTPASPITLSGLGAARTVIRSDGAEVQVDLGGGRWVRVRGTEPVGWLARYADRLRRPAD